MSTNKVTEFKNLSFIEQLLSGLAGSSLLPLLIYFVMVSCRLKKPMGIIITGSSSAGKSYYIKYIAKLFPEEWLHVTSKISDAVLSKYERQYFKNKIVLFDEAEGVSEGAGYFFRILLSELEYTYDVTSNSRTVSQEVIEGPISLIGTTSDDIKSHREDNINRLIVAEVDQTVTQTELILKFQAQQASSFESLQPDQKIVEMHKNFLRSLQCFDVLIPFAAEVIPRMTHINARRDYPKILDLIRVAAFLRQKFKAVKTSDCGSFDYIEADIKDYECIYPLLDIAFKVTINESLTAAEYYDDIFVGLQKNKVKKFTKKDVEAWLGFGGTKSQEIIKQLLEGGFATVFKASKSNQPAIYELSKERPKVVSPFVTPEELRAACARNDGEHANPNHFQ